MSFEAKTLLYGGDYNPDQWLDDPEILKQDIELMKKAHVNTVSLGIFAWSKLEPEDGVYDFDWMEDIMNTLYENGISVNLATPSGARPHWLADKYPEVLRVNQMRQREVFGTRHNHCYTSPAYRKKVWEMNTKLAERFDSHPAVQLWHISNEYGGECHCPLCQDAFRGWLKKKYKSIDVLNKKWNTAFWSHTYDDWSQIESPTPIGETSIHGLYIDWRRFVTHQTVDFCAEEIKAIRAAGGTKPATTNFMYNFYPIDYHEFAKILDVVCWDSYPLWHKGPESHVAMDTGMQHDIMRTLKKQPFLLMESCPGPTNWQSVSKLKRPGMLEAASLQAVAHGSDSVLYFQIRKGRGGFEKFHGALIDHYGKEDERTYQECKGVGEDLIALSEVVGSDTKADVAVIYDYENRWALEEAQGPRNKGIFYKEAVEKSYQAFRKQGLNVDMIDMTQELDDYKIVVAPVLYMFRPGFTDRVRAFVENGGKFVLTYWSGVVDESDLCFLGGTPGELMDVMGLRSTELDALYDGEKNSFGAADSSEWKKSAYECDLFCQLVEPTTAETLMVYKEDFYEDTPALTVNQYGKGKAYYVCANGEQDFFDEFYGKLVAEAGISCTGGELLPEGIEITKRESDTAEYLFVQNFGNDVYTLPEFAEYEIIFYREVVKVGPGKYDYSSEFSGVLPKYATCVLKKCK